MRRGAVLAALALPATGMISAVALAAGTMLPAAQACAAATYTSHVTLVVEHANTEVIGLCIGFDGPSITGEQILQASGVQYATQSYGSLGDAVCQIDGEPASYGSCLPASGPYWAMFVSRGGGAWQGADRGISTETFADGDAEGFRYDDQGGPEPPPVSPAGICARALAGAAASTGTNTNLGNTSGVSQGSAPGGTAAGADQGASAPVTASAAPAGAEGAGAPSPNVTPAPAVVSPTASRAGVANGLVNQPRPPSAPDPWVLAACMAGGGLAGLAVVRLVRRRRA